jgi:Glycosyltransferases involved in cell wall biogenesis
MRVSIIVPIYNVEKYITRCLDSVHSQTYTDIECILVDDKGQDGSMQLAKQFVEAYKGPIKFVLCEHFVNQGLSAARNTGLKKASGDYVFFLDSDDSLPDDSIERLVHEAEEYQYPEIVSGVTRHVLADDSYYDVKTENFRCNEDVFRGYIHNSWNIIACNKLIRKDIFSKHKTFFLEGITHEDVLWSFEISTYIENIIGCPHVTYNYYLGDMNSISRSPLSQKRVLDSLIILQRKASYLSNQNIYYLLSQHIKDNIINLSYTLVRNRFPISFIKEVQRKATFILTENKIDKVKASVPFYRKVVFKFVNLLSF